jgi:Flp pilus assembly protein TadD
LLAAGAGTEQLAAHVRQVRAAVDAAVADSDLLSELDQIRAEGVVTYVQTERLHRPGLRERLVAPWYAAALRSYGVDLSAPEEAAARVRDSRLRMSLLAALDDWRRITPDKEERQRLEAVLAAVEPEPNSWEARWRAAVQKVIDLGRIAPEKAGQQSEAEQQRVAERARWDAVVVQLAKEREVQALPAAAVAKLAHDLLYVGSRSEAQRVLRAGQERYPGDFWLNFTLGVKLIPAAPPLVGPPAGDERLNFTLGVKLIPSLPSGLVPTPVLAEPSPIPPLRLQAEEAVLYLTTALALRSSSPVVHAALGDALGAKGDVKGAIRQYRFALQIDSNYSYARYRFGEANRVLGNSLTEKGQFDEAIAAYREAIAADPIRGLDGLHYALGYALHYKGSLDDAIREYREAIRLAEEEKSPPGMAAPDDAHLMLGVALAGKGQRDEAITEYREANRIATWTGPPWHMKLGIALRRRGLVDDAIAAFREAIRLDPKDAGALLPRRCPAGKQGPGGRGPRRVSGGGSAL